MLYIFSLVGGVLLIGVMFFLLGVLFGMFLVSGIFNFMFWVMDVVI